MTEGVFTLCRVGIGRGARSLLRMWNEELRSVRPTSTPQGEGTMYAMVQEQEA